MSNDMFDLYSKQVMKYFRNPVNMGKIVNADAVATVGNPKCGDVMKVYLRIAKRLKKSSAISHQLSVKYSKTDNRKLKTKNTSEYYIKDIKVQTLGCGAAIATSSIATEFVKGKSLDEAMKLTNKRIVKALGGLPRVKVHCSLLAEQGIKEAIKNFHKTKINKE